ncbi:MAG: hypothetical protein ACYDAY_04895 [Candidatus Dormibacteria bacterium]
MSDRRGGFGPGLLLGAAIGFAAGFVLAGREERDRLGGIVSRGIELKSRAGARVERLRRTADEVAEEGRDLLRAMREPAPGYEAELADAEREVREALEAEGEGGARSSTEKSPVPQGNRAGRN